MPLKALLTFARARGFAATNAIDIRSDPSRQVQTFLAPSKLRVLDAAARIAELPSARRASSLCAC